jgi:hypothetical protein
MVQTRNTKDIRRLILNKRLITHHKPPKVGKNFSLTWTTFSGIMQTPTSNMRRRNHTNSSIGSWAIQLRDKQKMCLTLSWMVWRISWNKWGHTKWALNNSKKKLNWTQNQPQEIKGIEPECSTKGDDTYKDKIVLLALDTRLAWGWTLLTCFERPPKV